MMPLVIVRPEPGASATAAQARAMGIAARIIPLFEIAALNWTAPDPGEFDALLLTSANAIRFGGPQLDRLKGLPVHAVGATTAAAARAAGFSLASVGDGGARDMPLPAGESLLHLAGRDHRPAGAALTIAVYEARALPRPAALDDLEDCIIAVHSPRAGHRLAELVTDRSQADIAAISRAAADACGSGWRRVQAAPQPTDSAVLALAARLCESRGR
jgi:uroporphyrinogen-III synthase